jgi:membrane fusion protein, multidrug efflux system
VATSNSILVITFANDELHAGKNPWEAALSAGSTRLRPVTMTALAMILGMLPMSLGLGSGGEQNAPLGRAVIGGLLVASMFPLFRAGRLPAANTRLPAPGTQSSPARAFGGREPTKNVSTVKRANLISAPGRPRYPMTTPPTLNPDPKKDASVNPEPNTGRSGEELAQHPTRQRAKLKWLVLIIVLLAFGSAVYFLGILPRIENAKELAALAASAGQKTVIVVTPSQSSTAPELTLPGNIEANQIASIYSRVDGYIKKWNVDIGDQVPAGQVLAEVEAPQVDADLRSAQAELALAEANLHLAQTNSARSQALYKNRVNSAQELDTVLAAEQVQQATRDKAAAELTSAQALKDFESVRAPFAGTITARYIDVGSLVAAGSGRTVQKLFDLNQPDPLRVFVNVPQADVSSVTPGTPATITVDELSGQTFHGNITRDAGAFDQTSRTLLLQIDVPNPEGRLRPGMYAQAKFALQKPAATLLIPDNTIQIDAKGIRVFVVDAAGKIEIKPVKLGRDLGAKSEILTGINTADRVIQNPTPDLRQGMAVSVQPADR